MSEGRIETFGKLCTHWRSLLISNFQSIYLEYWFLKNAIAVFSGINFLIELFNFFFIKQFSFLMNNYRLKMRTRKRLPCKCKNLTARPRETGRAGRGEHFFSFIALLHSKKKEKHGCDLWSAFLALSVSLIN